MLDGFYTKVSFHCGVQQITGSWFSWACHGCCTFSIFSPPMVHSFISFWCQGLFPASSSQDKNLACLRLGTLAIIQSLLGLSLIVFAWQREREHIRQMWVHFFKRRIIECQKQLLRPPLEQTVQARTRGAINLSLARSHQFPFSLSPPETYEQLLECIASAENSMSFQVHGPPEQECFATSTLMAPGENDQEHCLFNIFGFYLECQRQL